MDILLLIIIVGVLILPIAAYMVMKFGTAGFLRARRREKEKDKKETNYEIEK